MEGVRFTLSPAFSLKTIWYLDPEHGPSRVSTSIIDPPVLNNAQRLAVWQEKMRVLNGQFGIQRLCEARDGRSPYARLLQEVYGVDWWKRLYESSWQVPVVTTTVTEGPSFTVDVIDESGPAPTIELGTAEDAEGFEDAITVSMKTGIGMALDDAADKGAIRRKYAEKMKKIYGKSRKVH